MKFSIFNKKPEIILQDSYAINTFKKHEGKRVFYVDINTGVWRTGVVVGFVYIQATKTAPIKFQLVLDTEDWVAPELCKDKIVK